MVITHESGNLFRYPSGRVNSITLISVKQYISSEYQNALKQVRYTDSDSNDSILKSVASPGDKGINILLKDLKS